MKNFIIATVVAAFVALPVAAQQAVHGFGGGALSQSGSSSGFVGQQTTGAEAMQLGLAFGTANTQADASSNGAAVAGGAGGVFGCQCNGIGGGVTGSVTGTNANGGVAQNSTAGALGFAAGAGNNDVSITNGSDAGASGFGFGGFGSFGTANNTAK